MWSTIRGSLFGVGGWLIGKAVEQAIGQSIHWSILIGVGLCFAVLGFFLQRIWNWSASGPSTPRRRVWVLGIPTGIILSLVVGVSWPKLSSIFNNSTAESGSALGNDAEERITIEERTIHSCGGSASVFGNDFTVYWIDCSGGGIRLQVEGSGPNAGTIANDMDVGRSWRFKLDNQRYSIAVALWPKQYDDSMVIRVYEILEEQVIIESKGKPCSWYHVVFNELEVRYARESVDSIFVQLMCYPEYDTIPLAFSGEGSYKLNYEFPHVVPGARGLIVDLRLLDPTTKQASGWTWPILAKGWEGEEHWGEGVHEDTLSSPSATYVARYEIRCEN
jgi:hypothetical protein